MVYASKPEVFGDGYADGIELTIPAAYLRLCVCCLTSVDVAWLDETYGATSIDDGQRDLLDNAIATITAALNDA